MPSLNLSTVDVRRLSDDEITQHFVDCDRICFDHAASPKSYVEGPPLPEIVAILRRLGPLCPHLTEIDFGEALQQMDGPPTGLNDLLDALRSFANLKSIVDKSFGDEFFAVLTAGGQAALPALESLRLNAAVKSLGVFASFPQLKVLRLRIAQSARADDVDALKTGCPNLTSLSIKEVESTPCYDDDGGASEGFNVMRLFRAPLPSGLRNLEELQLEEQRGGGGEVKAVYPQALHDIFGSCGHLKKLSLLMTFAEGGGAAATEVNNPFLHAPKSLANLHFRLAFPYNVNVDVDGFCESLVRGFGGENGDAAALESLSFQSYDHALQRIYDNFFSRICAGNGGILARALRCVDWHVDSVAAWAKLREATASMSGLKKLNLTVKMSSAELVAVSDAAATTPNSSVEEIVVDFLPNERNMIAVCCFGSSSNVR